MEPSEYRTMYAVEERHWWYVGMRRITLGLLDELYGARDDLRILDAGSGTGAAMVYLSRYGAVSGIDFSPLALGFCRKRGLTSLGQASVTALPFAAASFDLITSFDVLYHRAVGDYHEALLEFQRALKPGGRLLLRLPAYDRLSGRHGKVIHSARRFNARHLSQSLCEAGFAVERLTYANTLLFPAALAKRTLEPLLPPNNGRSDISLNAHWVDKTLGSVLSAEAAWLRRRDLPFGLTVIALARK